MIILGCGEERQARLQCRGQKQIPQGWGWLRNHTSTAVSLKDVWQILLSPLRGLFFSRLLYPGLAPLAVSCRRCAARARIFGVRTAEGGRGLSPAMPQR